MKVRTLFGSSKPINGLPGWEKRAFTAGQQSTQGGLMIKRLADFLEGLWAKEAVRVGIAYFLFMLAFYFLGQRTVAFSVTFACFMAIVLLTGLFFAVLWFIRKITG